MTGAPDLDLVKEMLSGEHASSLAGRSIGVSLWGKPPAGSAIAVFGESSHYLDSVLRIMRPARENCVEARATRDELKGTECYERRGRRHCSQDVHSFWTVELDNR